MAKQNDATHVKGIKSGNAKGNYERMAATSPTGRRRRSARRASTPARASRSTRGCRTCRPRSGRARASPSLGAARVEHTAVPTLRFALGVRVGDAGALGAARRPDPDRRPPARVRRGRARPAVRALRPGGRLGHDAAHAAVDAHDARRAGLRGLDGGRPRRAVLVRPRGRRLALPGRALRRRRAARVPVQRQRLLHRRATASCRRRGCRGRARRPTRCRCGCGRRRWSATSAARRGCGSPRRASTGCRRTSRATRSPPGTTRWRRSAYERPAHARRRGHVRGLHALAVPSERAEEPAPLDVRLRLPARLDRRCTPTTRR